MRPRSLRVRLLLGSVLWTLGLLYVAHMLSLAVMSHLAGHGAIEIVYFKSPHGGSVTTRANTTAVDEMRREIHDRNRGLYAKAAILAGVFMLAGLWLVRSGVRPIVGLRNRLAAIRDGKEHRIGGDYPAEVQPLVSDLNALLEHREQLVSRAVAKAGDLAHGLKTPLAVLAQEADRAEATGQTEIAETIRQQVERMRRQIEVHLAHTRASASGTAPGLTTPVLPAVEGIVRTMQRLHADRGLTFEVRVATSHSVHIAREDLDEMLGNLLDNACKWAGSRVAVQSTAVHDGVEIAVADDGPGIEPALREAVLRRGVRADEAAPGSGLGLAIVRDLADLCGGSISLRESELGGLEAVLRLPG